MNIVKRDASNRRRHGRGMMSEKSSKREQAAAVARLELETRCDTNIRISLEDERESDGTIRLVVAVDDGSLRLRLMPASAEISSIPEPGAHQDGPGPRAWPDS